MDNLYKFLKRNSVLFSPKIGRAHRIKESYTKVNIIYNPNFYITILSTVLMQPLWRG